MILAITDISPGERIQVSAVVTAELPIAAP